MEYREIGKYIAAWRSLSYDELRIIREYDRIVGPTVRYPDKIGYMMEKLDLSGEKPKVTARSGYYYSTVLQSHILEYELYLFYRKCCRNKRLDVHTMSPDELLDHLPLRRKIHEACSAGNHEESYKACVPEIHFLLVSGTGRDSLMGVQIMVLIENRSHSYDCVRIRRSENVVAKAGFIQFIPSGGFEAFNDGEDIDVQRANYSICKVLFRELGEECFGMPETPEFCRRPSEDIYNQPGISDVITLLGTPKGEAENSRRKAEFQLVGVTQGLVSLRPEFCFLLVIHDPDISSKIVCNTEAHKMITLVDIRRMEMAESWPNKDLANLNGTSAALWEICKESSLYKKCLEEAYALSGV